MSLQPEISAKNTRLKTLLALAGMSLIALMWMESGTGAVLDNESVCVTVTVIGMDGMDPGTSYCDVPIASSVLSSSVSSSLSSSTASVSSPASSAAGASSARASVANGGRRHSISRSRLRILRLLEEWAERNEEHLAAPVALPFEDVHATAWYRPYLLDLFKRGWITPARLFRPAEGATRAEVAKLLVLAHDGVGEVGTQQHFDDVPPNTWYYGYIEEAALNGWMLGYNDCYGTRPCYTRPDNIVTRAEGAAFIIRAFKLKPTGTSHMTFTDVPQYAWYAPVIATAADHCLLKGDDGRRTVRPDDYLNRAEIVAMVWRAASGGCAAADEVLADTASDAPETVASIDGGMIPSASEDSCTAGAWKCMVEAAQDDMRMVFSFGTGAFIPQWESVHAAAPSEYGGWFIGALIVSTVFIILFVVFYSFKRAHKGQSNKFLI